MQMGMNLKKLKEVRKLVLVTISETLRDMLKVVWLMIPPRAPGAVASWDGVCILYLLYF